MTVADFIVADFLDSLKYVDFKLRALSDDIKLCMYAKINAVVTAQLETTS